MLLYSVCYYYGKNKKKNLIHHLNFFNKIKEKDDIFILTVMIDSKEIEIHNKVKEELSDLIVKSRLVSNNNYKILTSYNWGGTILGLWMTYQFGKDKKKAYIIHLEEDLKLNNYELIKDVKKIFDMNKDYVYVGESDSQHPVYKNRGIIKHAMNCRGGRKNKCRRVSRKMKINMSSHACGKDIKNCTDCGGIIPFHQVWTDGGLYFSQINRLQIIEEKIGIFHKGNQNTKWQHIFDGVELGEVGFPTLLYHYGFTFGSVYRGLYFTHDK
jgi:hypothetical protein